MMKKITTLLLMISVFVFLSGTAFAQFEISDLEKEMMQNYQAQKLDDGSGEIVPLNALAATPITAFPFVDDFESGTWSAHTEPYHGTEANATIASGEGNGSTYAALLEGNDYESFYHNTDCESSIAGNTPIHNAGISMTIVPSGAAGILKLKFDYDQFFSFSDYYNAFRVTVNGNPITDENGISCFKSNNALGEGWRSINFDLSAYQNDASFDLKIDFIGKYYRNYYQGGDAIVIDNLRVFYMAPASIPVSNWAILFGVLLISIFIAFFYRRRKIAL